MKGVREQPLIEWFTFFISGSGEISGRSSLPSTLRENPGSGTLSLLAQLVLEREKTLNPSRVSCISMDHTPPGSG